MDNTLFDFIKAKLAACNTMVDFIGAGDPDEIFNYFLRKGHGFENWKNIEDYLKDNELYSEFKILLRISQPQEMHCTN